MIRKSCAATALVLLAMFPALAACAQTAEGYSSRRHNRPWKPHGYYQTPVELPEAVSEAAIPLQVTVNAGKPVNKFSPFKALGAGVDAVDDGSVGTIYTPQNVAQMLNAGYHPLTYRLYTELSVQDWHWNPSGAWSGANKTGYFTGDVDSAGNIADSYGYRLPYRGFTHDQGSDDDYSRLTDGSSATFWKSNPYLSSVFTEESDLLHPQWAIVDLGASKPVSCARLVWGKPYAMAYQVQYFTGSDPIWSPADGSWKTFPSGSVTDGAGGTVLLKLASAPVSVRFLRILMTASSGPTSTSGVAGDIRTQVGYALCEVGFGTMSGGAFADIVKHRASNSQTVTYVSSVDPWHSAASRVTDEEQPGLDTVYQSGIANGLGAMIPVGVLYNTPENAVAEIRYILHRHNPISYIELGEEPDGQFMTPEDYGALYLQFAAAIHGEKATLKLGGPVLESESGVQTWPDASGETGWLKRFVTYLNAHGALADLSFYSCEHYPFDPCDDSWAQLLQEHGILQSLFDDVKEAGLPSGTPVFITETNVSYGYTQAQPEIMGALWHADMTGDFLTQGGDGVYFYEYEPIPLASDGGCYGSFSLWTADASNNIVQPLSQYWSSQIVNKYWIDPVDGAHTVYPAATSVIKSGNEIVTAYALHRPDGLWSVMLINKDSTNTYQASVAFVNGSAAQHFSGAVSTVTFGSQQYVWHANGANGSAQPDGPPATGQVTAAPGTTFTLPPGSITVLLGTPA